jgi:hypothetical protein
MHVHREVNLGFSKRTLKHEQEGEIGQNGKVMAQQYQASFATGLWWLTGLQRGGKAWYCHSP